MEGEDPGRHVRSALWHDFHEALTLDTSYLGLRFLSPREDEVRRIVGLPEITEIALDADHMDVIVAAWSWGKPEGKLWIESMMETLRSDAAREIVEDLLRYPSPSHVYRALLKGAPVGPAERRSGASSFLSHTSLLPP